LIVAVFIPAFVRVKFISYDFDPLIQFNTTIGISLCVIFGWYFLNKITVLPGCEKSHYVLVVYSITFTLFVLFFFLFRLNYSRSIVVITFFITVIWTFFLSIYVSSNSKEIFAVVPGGKVEILRSIGHVNWIWLTEQKVRPGISGIVADFRADLSKDWEHFLAENAVSGVKVFHVKQLTEALLGKVEIEHIAENTLGSLNPNPIYLEIKQAVDWISALFAFAALLPVFIVISALIRLDSPGPVLFRQVRKGYRGEDFTVYKFRTMFDPANAVPVAEGAAADTHPAAPDERGRHMAITNASDRRVTPIGRFLRRTRIDEFPQIINILRREMSWIGPRPEALALSAWYETELPFYTYRHIVRPGISGWAQVNQGHVAAVDDVQEKLNYDFYYIKNFSLWLDVLIVFQTLKTMTTGHGAR
jgi:lipopolysaccharide/colanic/teichoic acid biosynthesis glycosyltransferase